MKLETTEFGLCLTSAVVLMLISSPQLATIVDPTVLAKTDSLSTSPLPIISTIPTAPSTIGQAGKDGDFTTQAALSSLSARPTNNIVNTNSFYDVVFLAVSSGAIKKIEVTFPAGTIIGIPTGAFFNEAEKCVPGTDCTELTSTASKSGQTITYTINNAVNVPAGTKIKLEFANIHNPQNPSTSYQVTVTTRDATNAIIDGPSQSSTYTIRQIDTNDIADNAITSTKPNEGFMKRVTLLDNAAGNAKGWNPDNSAEVFTIEEPQVSTENSPFFIIEVKAPGNRGCAVMDHDSSPPSFPPSRFTIHCFGAPEEGSELHYVVGNLPPNVS
jgi:hypothetical protein